MVCHGRKLQSSITGLFCLLVLATSANAQTVSLWGRWEQTFTARVADVPNTQVVIELTSPSGKTFAVSGFWDGGTTWRVRFMPVEAGTWHYRTRSNPVIVKKSILRERLDAQWFNPRTGQRISIKRSMQEVFEAPDQQDWVLLLSSK